MNDLPPARRLLRDAPARRDGSVVLSYDERLMRRKRLMTEAGQGFLVDLPQVTNLDEWWGFELEDGRTVAVLPADEALIEARGPGLARLAWHIGNRHTPCQIEADRLLIRQDHVLEGMLRGLGATLARVTGPFTPERGAYGTGRPMGHDHGGHDHGHDSHGHDGAAFGWHDHGDGHLHFHPAPSASLPFGHAKAK